MINIPALLPAHPIASTDLECISQHKRSPVRSVYAGLKPLHHFLGDMKVGVIRTPCVEGTGAKFQEYYGVPMHGFRMNLIEC